MMCGLSLVNSTIIKGSWEFLDKKHSHGEMGVNGFAVRDTLYTS